MLGTPKFALVVLAALAALVVFVSPVEAGDGPRRDPEYPEPDFPSYLHTGPWGGLCTQRFTKEQGEIVATDDVLYIRGNPDNPTTVRIFQWQWPDDPPWIADLVVRKIEHLQDGNEETEEWFPYYEASEETGGLTLDGQPDTNFKFIFYVGGFDEPSAVRNRTTIPTRADGWFTLISVLDGGDGFQGGSGPDCVIGSNNDDRIFTNDGSDFVRSKYGDDFITLGGNNDYAEAGDGDDIINGNGGADIIRGGGGDDCFNGGDADGRTDLLDAQGAGFSEINHYVPEPGTVSGISVPTIDIITEAAPILVDCP